MSNDIQDAVDHALIKQQVRPGHEISEETGMNMMNDIWKELQEKKKALTGNSTVTAKDMAMVEIELEKSLKPYGVQDVTFYDSNHDGKADKDDDVSFRTSYHFSKTFNLADRPGTKVDSQKALENLSGLPAFGTPPWILDEVLKSQSGPGTTKPKH